MTTFYSVAGVGVDDGTVPALLGDASLRSGKVHAVVGIYDLGAQAVLIGDEIDWGAMPKGAVPLMGFLDTNRSLGSSTIDVAGLIGATRTAAQFRAAAVFTATDTPTPFMKGAAAGLALTAGTRIRSVVAAANMPNNAGDRLTCIMLYTTPHSG